MAKSTTKAPEAGKAAPEVQDQLAATLAELEATKAQLEETNAMVVQLAKGETKEAGTFTVDNEQFKVVAGGIVITSDQSFDWKGEAQLLQGGKYTAEQFTSDSALTRFLVLNKSTTIEALNPPA